MNRRAFLKNATFMATAVATSTLLSCNFNMTKYTKPKSFVLHGEKLLLTNVSVIDVVAGRIDKGQILLQNGRIVDVFHQNYGTIASDLVLDLKGAYVTPGFINAHCHLSMPCTVSGLGGLVRTFKRQIERNAEECIKHGVTTVRDMAALSSLLHNLKVKITDKSVVGPRIITSYILDVSRGYLTSLSAYGLLGDNRYYAAVNNPREAEEGVRKAVDQGAGLIKIAHQPDSYLKLLPNPRQMDLKTTQAICNEAEKKGITVALHHTNAEGFLKGLSAGVKSFEHVTCDRILTDQEIQRLKNSGAFLTPTASVGYAISWKTNGDTGWDEGMKALIVEERKKYLIDFAREYCEDVIATAIINEFYRYSDPDYFDRFHIMPTINMDATRTILTYGIKNLDLLYQAGIKMGCGNDGGIPFDFPGAMGLEMYLLEKKGFNPADILRMATINNAELIGMESDLGTIEAGKIGDLVVFENNPLETFRHVFKPLMVFQNGELAYKA